VRHTRLLLAALVLAVPALASSGCETTAEKSAKLEKAAKRVIRAQQSGLSITHVSKVVLVTSKTLVRGGGGAAAVLTLRNSSAKALRDVPISISLKNAHGSSVYTNATPGLAATLTSLALLPAHGRATWIDDQIPTAASGSLAAEVGEGTMVHSNAPALHIDGAHLGESPSGGTDAEGTIANRSPSEQSEVVIYGVARRHGRIVAAGRAVLASLPAGASAPFQVFFIGDPNGAQLQLTAPATTSA
jgi:hypothetical protein